MQSKTGGAVSYYVVQVNDPNQGSDSYQAECGDIIEALGMTFNEGCAFKALWRTAAARSLGKVKHGHDALYDAQKVVFYGERMVSQLEYAVMQEQIKAVQDSAAKVEDPFAGMFGMLLEADDIITGAIKPSEAMKQAMDGGLTDGTCPYMCFRNNVCNKCGHTHDGRNFIKGTE